MLDPYDPNCMIHEEYQEPEAVDYRRNLSPPASHHHHHHNEDRRRSDSYRQSNGLVGGPRRNGRSRSPSDRYSNGSHYNNGNQGRYRRSPSSRRYDPSDQSRFNSNGGSSSYRSSYKSSNGSQGGRRSSRSRSPVHRPADPVYLAGQLQQQLNQQQQQQQPPTPEINFKWDRTVFVSNLPLDIRWFDLKDLFRRKVGDIVFSEVFEKDQKPLGFGAVTFRTTRDADRAVDVMDGYDLAGHKMIVKLDRDGSRTRRALNEAYSARKPTESGLAIPGGMDSINSLAQQLLAANSLLVNPLIAAAAAAAASNLPSVQSGPPPLMPPSLSGINSSNVSPQILNQIAAQAKVDGPVSTRLHVSGLSYRVDESRLRELFSSAGNLLSVIILRDRDNNSRGMANIEFETPLEALTALLTFNRSQLDDRAMNIIFDTRHASRSDSHTAKTSHVSTRPTPNNKYNGAGGPSPVPSIIGIQPNSSLLNSLLAPTGSVTPDLTASLAAALGLNPAATLGLLGNLAMPGGNLLNTMSSLNTSNKPPPPVNRVCKILVKNVPFSWDDFKIKEIFQKAGRIESVDGRTKGTAYIRYSSGDEARKAIDQLNGARFEGRTLEITFDYH